jgi:hypothetical protein
MGTGEENNLMSIAEASNQSKNVKQSASDLKDQGPKHRRRPKDETEKLILDEAEVLLISMIANNSEGLNVLASVRITDVLNSINSNLAEDQLPMTTGAAYQIWDSQVSFQDALLNRIMSKVSTPWEVEFRSNIELVFRQNLTWQEAVKEIFASEAVDGNWHELTLAIGLTAFVSPHRIRLAEEKSNIEYVRVLGSILNDLLAYSKRRVIPGFTIEDMVWAIEAASVGLHLRTRTHPELVNRAGASGGSLDSIMLFSLFTGMTEPHLSSLEDDQKAQSARPK